MMLALDLKDRMNRNIRPGNAWEKLKCLIRGKIVLKAQEESVLGMNVTSSVGQETCVGQHRETSRDRLRLKDAPGAHGMLQDSPAARPATLQESSVFCFLVEPENLQTVSPPHFFLGVIIVQDTERPDCGRCGTEREI